MYETNNNVYEATTLCNYFALTPASMQCLQQFHLYIRCLGVLEI